MKVLAAVVLLLVTMQVRAAGLEPSSFSLVEPAGSRMTPVFSGYAGLSMATGGGRTLARGTSVGRMTFPLHEDWTMSLDLGYSRLYDFRGFSSGRILGGVDLRWKPSDDFTLQLHFDGSMPDSSFVGRF